MHHHFYLCLLSPWRIHCQFCHYMIVCYLSPFQSANEKLRERERENKMTETKDMRILHREGDHMTYNMAKLIPNEAWTNAFNLHILLSYYSLLHCHLADFSLHILNWHNRSCCALHFFHSIPPPRHTHTHTQFLISQDFLAAKLTTKAVEKSSNVHQIFQGSIVVIIIDDNNMHCVIHLTLQLNKKNPSSTSCVYSVGEENLLKSRWCYK